jgi:hypothetical protein
MQADSNTHSEAHLAEAREAELLAEVDELIREGVLRPVEAEWVTTKELGPGAEIGFTIVEGNCAHRSHAPAWITADTGKVCGWCHRRVEQDDEQGAP